MAENLRVGVGEDGVIDEFDVETYYHECQFYTVDNGNEFVEIVFSNGGLDGVTRISFSELKELGFVKIDIPTPPASEARQ